MSKFLAAVTAGVRLLRAVVILQGLLACRLAAGLGFQGGHPESSIQASKDHIGWKILHQKHCDIIWWISLIFRIMCSEQFRI